MKTDVRTLVIVDVHGHFGARLQLSARGQLVALHVRRYDVVRLADGQALYGVKVKIRRADEKKARWELYSNHTGEFAQRLPAGKADYIVWADVKGYKLPSGKHLKPGSEVTVHIDDDERSDIGLHLDW